MDEDSDEESDDEREEVKELTEEEKKTLQITTFTKSLNQKKAYFKDIEKKVDPIYEARESEEQTLQTI